nr:secreted frizzled-related protein 3-like [Procambarus clarkii]
MTARLETPAVASTPAGRRWAVWVVWAVVGGALMGVEGQFGPQCEEIKIPMCQKMPYNLTRLPNLLHHSSQENAQLAIEQFELLGWTRCSDQLQFFLCSMYAPICTLGFVSEAIPPCRSVCEAARLGCEPLLAKFNIPWPTNLDCEALPLYDQGVCITPQAIISSDVSPSPAREQEPCQCSKPRPLRQRVYARQHYNYVLRGTVKSVETYGDLTLTTVVVKEVVVTGRVLVLTPADAHLWTNRSCICPPLSLNQDYLLLGWEDADNSRLLYLEGSIALPYKRKYVLKIQKWEAAASPKPPPFEPPVSSTAIPPLPRIQTGRGRRRKGKNNQRRKNLKRQRKIKNKRRRKQNREGGTQS